MKHKKKIQHSFSLVIIILVLGSLTASASSTTWTVHPTDIKANFTKIQDAVDNASTGDSIEVWNGTYTENILVNKSLTIYSRDGKDVTIVQANDSSIHVFNVTADWVNISELTVKDASVGVLFSQLAGIHLSGVAHCNISDNFVTNNDNGIALINSSGNTIRNNLAKSNIIYGIYLESSDYNTVTNNNASFNLDWSCGISLWNSSYNKIINNIASSNGRYSSGIELLGISRNNLIDNNNVNSNGFYGIIFWYFFADIDFTDNNTITNNTVNYNYYDGIYLSGEGGNNTVKNNIANSNGASGLSLSWKTNNNTLENNSLNHNEYSGIELSYFTSHNIIKNNSASHNNDSGIALYHSSSNNIISHNELFSNQFGLSLAQLTTWEPGAPPEGWKASNNQLMNNKISNSKSYGIYLLDINFANNVTCNTVSNSSLFGILIENSTAGSIGSNTANFNERGIGLNGSHNIKVMDNVANSNKISGISLINSSASEILNNIARFNVYEGIYLSNSDHNNISSNDVSGKSDSRSYFGISLYSSNNNSISNNNAGSNYYSEVFQYSSTGNTVDSKVFNQTDEIQGVRVYIPKVLTPSLQSVLPSTNATYYIVVENLGTKSNTFDLNYSSSNVQYSISLDKNRVSLSPGAISANTTVSEIIPEKVKMYVETIKLDVSGNEPDVCRVNVEAISKNDSTIKDSTEAWTIVQGKVASYNSSDSQVIASALVGSNITAGSKINTSAIINCSISGSSITASILRNSTVVSSTLNNVILENATVNGDVISRGSITVNGVTYIVTYPISIKKLVTAYDIRDSDLVGIKYGKTLFVDAENSNLSFDISAKGDYFAGSISVQRSIIPPFGFNESNNVTGGYVYVEVSKNVANSTGNVTVKVYYDPLQLGDLDESSLKLRYYNESAARWEDISISGINTAEHYVWGNLSHYCVFSVSGSVTPKKVTTTTTPGHGWRYMPTPTPTPTHTPTPSPTPTPTLISTPITTPTPLAPTPITGPAEISPTPTKPTPGFDLIVAAIGSMIVTYLRKRIF